MWVCNMLNSDDVKSRTPENNVEKTGILTSSQTGRIKPFIGGCWIWAAENIFTVTLLNVWKMHVFWAFCYWGYYFTCSVDQVNNFLTWGVVKSSWDKAVEKMGHTVKSRFNEWPPSAYFDSLNRDFMLNWDFLMRNSILVTKFHTLNRDFSLNQDSLNQDFTVF